MNIFFPNSEIEQINILAVFFENLVKICPEIGPGETSAQGKAIGYFHRDQPLYDGKWCWWSSRLVFQEATLQVLFFTLKKHHPLFLSPLAQLFILLPWLDGLLLLLKGINSFFSMMKWRKVNPSWWRIICFHSQESPMIRIIINSSNSRIIF